MISECKNISNRNSKKIKFICPVCKSKFAGFVHKYNSLRISWNSACPHCDSRSRHRGLFFLYKEILHQYRKEISVLHFAPEQVFYPIFKNEPDIQYNTTDYFLEDVDFKNEDIQKLSLPSGKFDLILCNHVIEHIPSDEAAMAEMSRILKENGRAIITIPGNFRREQTVYFDHLKFNGHYRDYGLDVINKLMKYFKKVEAVDLSKYNPIEPNSSYGIRKYDMAFICCN